MKPIINRATFDLMVKLLIAQEGISKEEASNKAKAHFDLHPEFQVTEKVRESWTVVPNRADRRKHNK